MGHVTNGVHVPELGFGGRRPALDRSLWKGSLAGNLREQRKPPFARCPRTQLWQFRRAASAPFIEYARERLSRQRAASGAPPEAVEEARHLFDPDTLTLGFARRFATYKRPNLLLHDPERLLRLLRIRERPVQLIIAGKAHPADQARAGADPAMDRSSSDGRRFDPTSIFLSDYDMLLTEQLVQGVDVWINTPRRPWEACGTSGMKVLVNGGLNLSELDGWWAEAYAPEVGWAIGDGQEHGDDPAWDAADAEALYDLLEREVIPEFYSRDAAGVPLAWVARVRESMARLTPQFSAERAVREYTEEHYLPAAAAYRARTADHGALGGRISQWRRALEEGWGAIRFVRVTVEADDDGQVFDARVYLGDLDPQAIRVELYADGAGIGAPIRQEMKSVAPQEANVFGYRARVPGGRPAADYTVRLMPSFPGVAVPLEAAHILWSR